MTSPYVQFGAIPRPVEDLETTEPDLRLQDVDFLPAGNEVDDDAAAAFMEAKTEPARPSFDTLPDEPRPSPPSSRDEALLAFLETVRRVFGGENG